MGRRKKGLPGYNELIEQMVEGYLSGQSLRDLATSCEVSVPTVRGWLERAGIYIRSSGEGTRLQYARNGGKPKYHIPEDDLRREYLIEGKAVWRIAKDRGITGDVVDRHIRLYGLERTEEQKALARGISTRLRKQTCEERFGGPSPNYDPKVRKKTMTTNMLRHGVDNPIRLIPPHLSDESRRILSSPEIFCDYINSLSEEQRTIRQISELLGCSYDWVARNTRGEIFEGLLRREVSAGEREVREFMESLGVQVKRRDRSVLGNQELDIYCPDQKVAIEYNGIYWHSSQFKDRKYHLDKTLGCEKAGVRLIHVWEHMWTNPQKHDIYKNMIKHALGMTEHRIGARGTSVEKRPASVMRPFFEENNIQGYRMAKWAYVLADKETGLDLMCYTTGHAYFGKGIYDMEIARGACRLGWSISGGATKLWKAIIEDNPDVNSIIYYVDLNHYNGSSVSGLPGVRFIKTQPGFWNWHYKDSKMRNREPQRHAEITAGYKDGSILQVHNAGTAVYLWERV